MGDEMPVHEWDDEFDESWNAFKRAYAAARTAVMAASPEAIPPELEAYLKYSEALEEPRRLGFAVDLFHLSYTQAVGAATADLDLALKLLQANVAPDANARINIAGRVDLAAARAVMSPRDEAFAIRADPVAELTATVNGYFDEVVRSLAATAEDVAALVGTIGISEILGVAGKAASDAIDGVPGIKAAVRFAIRLIDLAVDRLRKFLGDAFEDLEKQIAQWVTDKIGNQGFTASLLTQIYGIDGLKQQRADEIASLPPNFDLERARAQLKAAAESLARGDQYASGFAKVTAKLWPFLVALAAMPGAEAVATGVGGVVASALLAFVVVRGADFVDVEKAGPFVLPNWIDFVDGPTSIIARLAPQRV